MVLLQRILENIAYKIRYGGIIVPIVILFLVVIDFVAFYDLIIQGDQAPMVAVLIAGLYAVALQFFPVMLAIAFMANFSMSIKRNNKADETIPTAVRTISFILSIFVFVSTVLLLFWITSARFDLMLDRTLASISAFEFLSTGLNSNPHIETFEGAWFSFRWMQHWHISESTGAEAFGYYVGFWVDRLLLISPIVTSLVAFFLSCFYFRGFWWIETLYRLSGNSELFDSYEEKTKKGADHRREALSAMYKAKKDMKRIQSEEKRELKKLEKEIKIGHNNLERSSKRYRETLALHESEMQLKTSLMSDLWQELGLEISKMPKNTEEFIHSCYDAIRDREIGLIAKGYESGIQGFYGKIESFLRLYKAQISDLGSDINDVIEEYNKNILDDNKSLLEWNTAKSRKALLDNFKSIMGVKDEEH